MLSTRFLEITKLSHGCTCRILGFCLAFGCIFLLKTSLFILFYFLFARTITTIIIKLTLHYGVRIYALQSTHYIQPTYSMLLTDKRTLTNSLGLQ